MFECVLYRKQKKEKVRCLACSQKCLISNGKVGICGVRKNIDGRLYLLVYGKLISAAIDLIEKKPLYHFLPRTFAFSIATVGCNFNCVWCQNSDISQASKGTRSVIAGKDFSPSQIVSMAVENKCPSIAYTYTEPVIAAEFYKEIAEIARQNGLKNIFVTNGYFTKESLEYFTKGNLIDAMNIDLKSFNEKTYLKYCGAKLKPVLETIKRAYSNKIHLEITTLLIPHVNDSSSELKKIARFIFSIDKEGKIPWHISRFFPRYKFADGSHEITSIEKLKQAEQIGRKAGLKYVYLGNV